VKISSPTAESISSASAENKESVKKHEVRLAELPVQTSLESDFVKIDEVEMRSVPVIQADKDIVGMQIGMDDSLLMQPSDKLAEGGSEALLQACATSPRKSRQGSLHEMA
jgi:hypothetical protein